MLRHEFCPAVVSIHSLQKVCDVVSEGVVLLVGPSTARPPIKNSRGRSAPLAVVSEAVLAAV